MITPRFALLTPLSLALFIPLVPALTVPALAQAPARGATNHSFKDPLGLTPTQKQQEMAIGMKAGRQLMAIRTDASLTPAARMAKMRVVEKSIGVQVMAILTPAQRVKLKAMMQQRIQAMSRQQVR